MKKLEAVYSIITNELKSKVLMVYNVEHQSWSLPGGAVEEGETLEEAIIRETKEETGLEIKILDIVSINERIFTKAENHVIFVTFRAEIIGGTEEIIRPDEITDIKWFDFDTANKLAPYYQGKLKELALNKGIVYEDQGRIHK